MFQGIVLVLAGASSYGLLAPFMKLAMLAGYSPAEVLTAQFLVGIAALAAFQLVRHAVAKVTTATRGEMLRLVLAGTSIGLTGSFYYLAVARTSVSLGIVLLMQSVWIGILVDALLTRRAPSRHEIVACAIILAGTVLATDVLAEAARFDTIGVVFGLLSAVSYAAVLWSSKSVAVRLDPVSRGLWMTVGGGLAALAIALPQLGVKFDPQVIWEWGWIMALLGILGPTLLFNWGMPKTGVALGMILSSAELPVAIVMARFVLGEAFAPWQWLGVAMILGAIVLANVRPADSRA
jgi:drug/metabolite transporter (DMT)-like permease